MNNETSENKGSSGSKKKLVRILIIIGIGIPVLIEILTLFNLVKVQFWNNEHTNHFESQDRSLEREIGIGDTLYSGTSGAYIIDEMRMDVDPEKWTFQLNLKRNMAGEFSAYLIIDSLRLNSGNTLKVTKPLDWKEDGDKSLFFARIIWEIPNGDIPRTLFFTVQTSNSNDTLGPFKGRAKLGHITVRYRER